VLLNTKANRSWFAELRTHKLLGVGREEEYYMLILLSFPVIDVCQIENTKLSGCFVLLFLGSY